MRMRRTWLRPTRMPPAWAACASASRVQCAGASGWAGASSPSPPWYSRPGGPERARAIILPRSVSVSRRGRPGPGRSPRPSTPSALNRCSRSRTVCGWQPSWSAIWVVRRPSQLWAIIRARRIQSPGACRAPASLRMVRSSAASTGGRANSRTGTAASSSARHHHAAVYTSTPPIPTLRNVALGALQDHHRAEDLAPAHLGEGLLDLVQRDRLGDEAVEVVAAAQVQVGEDREVAGGQAVAVPRRLERAAAAEEVEHTQVDAHLRVGDADLDEDAGVVAGVECLLHHV